MAADALDEILNGFKRLHAAQVEAEADPRTPGRTAYRITAATRRAVQGAIDARMIEAEDAGGFAKFIGPHPVDGGVFGALGEIIIPQKQAAA